MTKKYFHVYAAVVILLFHTNCVSQEEKNIIDFFPTADSIAENPVITQDLEIICQKKISNLFITFVGYKGDKKIFIAAITKEKITDPNKDIHRILDFENGEPRLGKVTTWGYVFDRNNDGKIDYMALVDGAAPFLDDRIPDSYPARGQKLGMPDLELYVEHCKIIFNHWADDNYDGKIDAVIHIESDQLRDWVKRRIVARCTKFNDIFNDVWAFKNKITDEREIVVHSEHEVPYRPLGKISGSIDKKTFTEETDILSLLNKTAAQCKIGKSTFPGE